MKNSKFVKFERKARQNKEPDGPLIDQAPPPQIDSDTAELFSLCQNMKRLKISQFEE